jgi:hypothetical protein
LFRVRSHAVAAAVITLGLGVFDLGPRARAELWLTLNPPTRPAVGANGLGTANPDFVDPDNRLPVDGDPRPVVPRISEGINGSSGCTSPSSSPSGMGAGAAALAGEGIMRFLCPDLFSLLRLDETIRGPSMPPSGIFEPPRLTPQSLRAF